MSLLSVEEAEKRIRAHLPAPRTVRIEAARAGGRVLAEGVRAPFPLPRFANSAMDGYAVRAADTSRARPDAPVRLRLAGESAAGRPAPGPVRAGECARCMTGAPIPAGADAVVMVEHASPFAATGPVEVRRPARPGENVRPAGEETPAGEVVLAAGTVLSPVEVGVLSTLGIGRVRVSGRLRAAVLVTGDEVVPPGRPLAPGQVYDANGPLLLELLRLAGARTAPLLSAPDDPAALRAAAEAGLAGRDLLLVAGGVSAGRHDFTPGVLAETGVAIDFHGVAVKPGKPLLFGTRGETLVFGVPGNPVSALACFLRFVEPAISAWTGRAPRPRLRAALAAPFAREPDRYRYLPGRARLAEGRLIAAPSPRTGSHMLTSGLGANCLIGAEAGVGPLPAGSEVALLPLPWAACPEV